MDFANQIDRIDRIIMPTLARMLYRVAAAIGSPAFGQSRGGGKGSVSGRICVCPVVEPAGKVLKCSSDRNRLRCWMGIENLSACLPHACRSSLATVAV